MAVDHVQAAGSYPPRRNIMDRDQPLAGRICARGFAAFDDRLPVDKCLSTYHEMAYEAAQSWRTLTTSTSVATAWTPATAGRLVDSREVVGSSLPAWERGLFRKPGLRTRVCSGGCMRQRGETVSILGPLFNALHHAFNI
jgi:hypothetical protein